AGCDGSSPCRGNATYGASRVSRMGHARRLRDEPFNRPDGPAAILLNRKSAGSGAHPVNPGPLIQDEVSRSALSHASDSGVRRKVAIDQCIRTDTVRQVTRWMKA